jgi:hypothetical protein
MPRSTFNLAKLRASSFDGNSTDLARAAQMILGRSKRESETDIDLRVALCQACNLPPPGTPTQLPPQDRGAKMPVALNPKVGVIGRVPNLSPVGKWEGRRRRVQFARAGNPEGTITLGWAGEQKWTILTPCIVDMPWPYWEIVKTRILVDNLSDNVRDWNYNKKKKTLEVTIEPTETPVYNFVDMGDTPGTEGLPLSYFEYFKQKSAETGVFKGFGRQALVLIYQRLRDGVPSTFFEGKDAIQMRTRIAEILGPDAVNALNEEIYAEETKAAG